MTRTDPALRRRRRSLYVWHRRVGVTASLLALWLALTGLPLNHTSEWTLDRRHLDWNWLMAVYGMEAPHLRAAYRVGQRHVVQLGDQVWLDQQVLTRRPDALRGAVRMDEGLLVLAFERGVTLADERGQIVDRLPLPTAEAPVIGLGVDPEGRPVLLTTAGAWAADDQLLGWKNAAATAPIAEVAPPEALMDTITLNQRGAGVSLERLLLDLHSGRILSMPGVLVADAAALALAFLGVSGLILWNRGRRRQRLRGPGHGHRFKH